MRKVLAPILALVLPSCTEAQVDVCEEYIKDRFDVRSYERVEVREGDEPVDLAELQRLRGKQITDSLYEDGKTRLGIHTVIITYDGENRYGGNDRGYGMCKFETANGELPDRDIMESRARMAASQGSLRDLADMGVVPDVQPGQFPEPEVPCCL